MKNQVDYDVALVVASHEAIIRQAYKDSVGKWTWSVGLTSATGHDVTRYIGKPASLQHCLNIYVWALKNYARQVDQAFKGHNLTKAQFAAAVSFHWNTGAIKRASWVKHFKAGNIEKARAAFMLYRKPPEVKERRKKERDLFFDGKWSNDGTMTEYTRLTSRSTPVWKSAKRINVREALRKAFGVKVIEDHKPRPTAKVTRPTLSPIETAAERPAPQKRPNLLDMFLAFFRKWRQKS
jgi:GH24 family phage-related lysozyme (muramidase)